jgi:hypothetical protein
VAEFTMTVDSNEARVPRLESNVSVKVSPCRIVFVEDGFPFVMHTKALEVLPTASRFGVTVTTGVILVLLSSLAWTEASGSVVNDKHTQSFKNNLRVLISGPFEWLESLDALFDVWARPAIFMGSSSFQL